MCLTFACDVEEAARKALNGMDVTSAAATASWVDLEVDARDELA